MSLSAPLTDSTFRPRDLCRELVTVFTKALLSTGDSLFPHSAAMLLEYLRKFEVTELIPQLLTFAFTTSLIDTQYRLTYTTSYVREQRFIEQVHTIGSSMGWKTLHLSLLPVFQKHTGPSGDVTICCDLMDKLVSTSCHSRLMPEQKSVCQELLQMVLKTIRDEDDIPYQPISYKYRYLPSLSKRPSEREWHFVITVLKLLITLEGSMEEPLSLIDTFVRQPNRYPLTTTLAPALKDLHAWLGSGRSDISHALLARCISRVESCSAAIVDPSDWSQNVTLPCKCSDCQALETFLRSDTQVCIHFKVSQPRRSHVREQLDRLDCYTSHFTDRSGSPRTLVVKKTTKLLEQKRQMQQQQMESIACLRKLCSQPSSSHEPLTKRPKYDREVASGSDSTSAPSFSDSLPTVYSRFSKR